MMGLTVVPYDSGCGVTMCVSFLQHCLEAPDAPGVVLSLRNPACY